jgi:hypothetical protein
VSIQVKIFKYDPVRMEDVVNQWLAKQGNIELLQVKQTTEHFNNNLVVSIFYKKGIQRIE